MGWNPGILAGVSVPMRPDLLFHDMHSYLAAAGGWGCVALRALLQTVCGTATWRPRVGCPGGLGSSAALAPRGWFQHAACPPCCTP